MSAQRDIETKAVRPAEDKGATPRLDEGVPATAAEPTGAQAPTEVPEHFVEVITLHHINIDGVEYVPGKPVWLDPRDAALLVGEYRVKYPDADA